MLTTRVTGTQSEANRFASETPEDAARGWYFYGITRRGSLAATDGTDEMDAISDGDAPLQLLEFSGLAAVVRPVLLGDFNVAALRDRFNDANALEAAVRSHNRVIEAIHARQAILPAKFGTVYAHADGVISALCAAHDTLLDQLSRLEACDEWSIHVYADVAVVRERISAEDPVIGRLRGQHALARPGRAYFLEQQLREELEAATQRALSALAQSAFDRLAANAVQAQVTQLAPAANVAGEVEILRAAFLVARDAFERFEAEVRAPTDASAGLRCESTGPWPPYSFAARDDEEAE